MWIADRWKDYEVYDTSNGEKLERWGDYVLVRPDPQVIWNTPHDHPAWKKKNGHYHRSSKGGGEWEFFGLPQEWEITYELPHFVPSRSSGSALAGSDLAGSDLAGSDLAGSALAGSALAGSDLAGSALADSDNINGSVTDTSEAPDSPPLLRFHLKPFAFKHTGLFPEQAVNWDWFSQIINAKISSGVFEHATVCPDTSASDSSAGTKKFRVLNLFAYTGGATIAAAAAGAFVTHVDASKGMVGWAKENAASSGIDSHCVRWLVDDCAKFVERELRRGNRYDGIIMDPPSYGRGPKGEIWKIEEAVYPLIQRTAQLLSDHASFFLINSYTTGLQPAVLSYMLETAIAKERGGKAESSEIGLPVSGNGLILPCGASGRWVS